jgi:hypothetical protein
MIVLFKVFVMHMQYLCLEKVGIGLKSPGSMALAGLTLHPMNVPLVAWLG